LAIDSLPFSPLGKGLLTGKIDDTARVADGDFPHRVAVRYREPRGQQNVDGADVALSAENLLEMDAAFSHSPRSATAIRPPFTRPVDRSSSGRRHPI
jgi:hypothetical protein